MGAFMSFAAALGTMAQGYSVARAGWHRNNMHIFQAETGTFSVDGAVMGNLEPFLVMRTADGSFVPWLASQSDMLATDWSLAQD